MSNVRKQLLSLLADGQFHSGTALSHALSVSRSAVWKQLQSLEAWGLEVVAVSGKGYKLQQPMQLLDSGQIHAALTPKVAALLQGLEIHDVLTSTNSYLLDFARQQSASAWVCLAEYQTAGKGRRGRTWVSPFGHNIYMSLLWRFQDGPAAISGLSLAIGVAVVRALRQAGITEAGLKWPNDIYWRGRKLAGILIEVSGESSGPCHAVIGLGLNLYLPPVQAEIIEQAWVDLQQILGGQIGLERNCWVALLLNEIVPVVAEYQTRKLSEFVNEWRYYDCLAGQSVNIFMGEQVFTGIVCGVDDQGLLLLEDEAGNLRTFASGEVSFRAS